MSGYALAYPRPANEQDFEEWCLLLFQRRWNCPDAQLVGTRGQNQDGVDIHGTDAEGNSVGGQCKRIDPIRKLTAEEVTAEVSKAKHFRPSLRKFVIFTTAKRDRTIQSVATKLTKVHRSAGLFSVQIVSWEDIDQLFRLYPDLAASIFDQTSLANVESLRDGMAEIALTVEAIRTDQLRGSEIANRIDDAADLMGRYDYDAAEMILTSIREKSWTGLDSFLKFRVLTNLGYIRQRNGDAPNAAKLFLEAKDYAPNELRARQNEAVAYDLMEDRNAAYKLALALVEDSPNTAENWALVAALSPSDTPLEELRSCIPVHLLQDADVAYNCALKAQFCNEWEAAETYARVAVSAAPKSYLAAQYLGSLLLRNISGKTIDTCLPTEYRDRVEEAEKLFTVSLSIVTSKGPAKLRAGMLYNRATARSFLSQHAEAESDFREACELDRCDCEFAFAYGRILADRELHSDSIRVLEASFKYSPSSRVGALLLEELMAIQALSNESISEIVSRGIEAFDEDDEYAIAFIDKAVKVYKLQQQLSDIIEKRNAWAAITGLLAEYATVKALIDQGRRDDARDRWKRHVEDAYRHPARNFRRHSAILAESLGLFEEAFALWRTLAASDVIGADEVSLMECGSRLKKKDFVLEYSSRLRSKGLFHIRCYEIEIEILEEVHELQLASNITEQYLQQLSSPSVKRYLNFRLLRLSVLLNGEKAVVPAEEALPEIGEVSPSVIEEIVRILGHLRRFDDAIRLAYRFYRARRDCFEAHRALIGAVLVAHDSTEILKHSGTVTDDCGVLYRENQSDELHSVIFENDDRISVTDGEYAESSEIFAELSGKSTGDEFFIRRHPIQDKKGRIVAVQSKYLRRFQECVRDFESKFPGQDVIASVQLEKQQDGELDLAPLFKSADDRATRIINLVKLYDSEFMPVATFAKGLSLTPFEGLQALVEEKQLLKCNTGSDRERSQAIGVLKISSCLVLDSTALSTLYWTDAYESLASLPFRLVVSEGTLLELRQVWTNLPDHRQAGTFGSNRNGTYFFAEAKAPQMEALATRFRKFLDFVEAKCEPMGGRSVLRLEPRDRDEYIKVCGREAVESAALALVPGHALWSDDGVWSSAFRSKYNVQRVWTQVVFDCAREIGLVDEQTRSELTIKLLVARYDFTALTAEDLSVALGLSSFLPDAEPLASVLRLLSSRQLTPESRIYLASNLIKSGWQLAKIEETAHGVTSAVLRTISSLENGISLVAIVRKTVQQILGIDVVTAIKVERYIGAWLKLSKTPLVT